MKSLNVILVVSCLVVPLLQSQAQNIIPAAGGNQSDQAGKISYTIGQVFYTLDPGSTGSVAKGVQQPYEIFVITEIENLSDVELSYKVYPNPASDILILKRKDYDMRNMSYQLFDSKGILLQSDKVEGFETTISVRSLAPAFYFLKVSDSAKAVKIFKIIKN